MKIVFVLTEIAVGGAERVVLDLCTELQTRNIKTAVIALKPFNNDDIMVQAFRKNNIKIYSLNADKRHPFKLLGLRRLISALAPNVVSSHLFHPNILCRLLLYGRNFKLVNTIHIMEIRRSQSWRFFVDLVTFGLADVHTAVSRAAADFQTKKLFLPKNSIKVIPNGINIPHTMDTNEILAIRRKWGVDDCHYVFGCVGRLNHQKGFDLLLNMTDKICNEIKNRKIGLVFIGDGPEKENLQKLAEKAPARMKIIFAGYSNNAASECSAFDVFLMPSRFEGFGLALIEAQAHGLPTVAQNIPPLAEVSAHYPNAILTDFEHTPYVAAQNIADSLHKERLITVNVPSISKMTDNYLKVFSGYINAD